MSNSPNNVRYEWINPSLVALNWNLNPREMDEGHIKNLARHMNAQGYNPNYPIIIYQLPDNPDPKSVGIAATGYHRIMASQFSGTEFPNLPLEKVYCEIREGTMNDVIRTMLEDNLKWTPGINAELGKMPNPAEIRNIRYRLMLFPDVFCKGDRWIAKEWNCDHVTVSRIRDEIIEGLARGELSPPPYCTDENCEEIRGIIENNMYFGLDGKEYPRATRVANTPETPKTEKRHVSINISVSPRLYEHLQKLAGEHDIISRRTENPKVTTLVTNYIKWFCQMNKVPYGDQVKEEGETTQDLLQTGFYDLIDRRRSEKRRN